jgi:L-rhamnose mutarotase
MKKILKEWNKFVKENTETEFDKEQLLNKVRDIFFGAFNSWSEEYKKLHDQEFIEMYSDLEKAVESNPSLSEDDKATILGNANIGLTLYWSPESRRGYGSADIVKKIIDKKLKILENKLTKEELEYLKNQGMSDILKKVSSDKGGMIYPTDLAVALGVINGQKVTDAYMTTTSAINNHLLPVLKAAGYQVKPTATKQKRKKQRTAPMSPEEMLAQMKAFGRK